MTHASAEETLIYGFDPLCGWCFAFGPSIRAVVEAYPDVPVTLMYGGLVVGERVQPIAAMRAYLERGLEQVRQTSGVAAGAAFYNGLLAEGRYISNSEPPCRAINVAEQIAPDKAFAFAIDLPDAFYGRGLPLDNADVMAELAASHGIDTDAFLAEWHSDAAKARTQQAFAEAQASGINSYPTLIYRRGDRYGFVARGFAPPDDAVARVAALRRAA